MRINKALVDRSSNIPSGNGDDNDAMMYRKLISLIDQYNKLAKDKGLPIKSIPVYVNNVNHTLMVRSMINLFNDIDRIKNIKEKEEEKTITGITFDEDNGFKDGIWKYTKDVDGNVTATLNADEFSKLVTNNSVTLEYEHMPYEKLIDADGKEYPVTSYYKAFAALSSDITTLNIDMWTNRNVTTMQEMFVMDEALKSLTLGMNFYTPKVTNMNGMFAMCGAFPFTLTLGNNFDTSNVTDMNGMFESCSFTTLSLENKFNTSKVTNMSHMFRFCPLITLTLGKNFNTTGVTDKEDMFEKCNALTTLSLYKTSDDIITYLPSATWNVTDSTSTIGTVLIDQGSSATWNPINLPDSWGEDEQWTLTLQRA